MRNSRSLATPPSRVSTSRPTRCPPMVSSTKKGGRRPAVWREVAATRSLTARRSVLGRHRPARSAAVDEAQAGRDWARSLSSSPGTATAAQSGVPGEPGIMTGHSRRAAPRRRCRVQSRRSPDAPGVIRATRIAPSATRTRVGRSVRDRRPARSATANGSSARPAKSGAQSVELRHGIEQPDDRLDVRRRGSVERRRAGEPLSRKRAGRVKIGQQPARLRLRPKRR